MSSGTFTEENTLVYELKKKARNIRPLKREEIVASAMFARRQIEREKCKNLGLVPCYVIGKAIFYIHCQEIEQDQNSRKIKYTLVRPDLNFCECGAFDYVVGLDPRDLLLDIYYSKSFNEF